MAAYADVAYRYDGTLSGLMCCIFESYARDEIPCRIEAEGADRKSVV